MIVQGKLSATQNISFNLLSQVPLILSGIIVSIITARLLGAEGKGIIGIYTQNIILINLLFGLGLNQAATYFSSKAKNNLGPILKFGLFHSIISLIITVSLALVLFLKNHGYTMIPEIDDFYWAYIYMSVSIILNQGNGYINAVLFGSQEYREANKLSILKAIISTILFSSLYAFGDRINNSMIIQVMIVSLIGNGLQLLLGLKGFNRLKIEWEQPLTIQQIKSFYLFSKDGYLSSILNYINYRIDIFILAYYVPISEIGIYLLAVNLSQMFWLVSDSFSKILIPIFTKKPLTQFRISIIFRFVRLHGTAVIMLSFIVSVLSPLLIPTIFGDEFSETALLLNILLIGNLFACSSKVLSIIPFASNNLRINVIATSIGVAFTLIFDFTLIPIYGSIGAAIASSISYLSIFISVLLLSSIKLQFPVYNPLVLSNEDFKFFISR